MTSNLTPELGARLINLAAEHGPGLVGAAVGSLLPRDADRADDVGRILESEAAALIQQALHAETAGEGGEAEALREIASGKLRTALHRRNLGAIEAHQEQAEQMRRQAVGAALAVLRLAAAFGLAAAGV